MSPVIHTFEQGTPEWRAVRAGIPTASAFATIMAKGKDGGASITRKKYLYQIAGEIITGDPVESFTNAHMARGHEMEPEARELYAFIKGVEPQQVGFIRNGDVGCSPDSLVGDVGMLEIKSKLPDLLIECLMRDGFPPEHKAQCQGALWVAEREWIDLMVYWPKMPPYIVRAHRDEAYIDQIAKAVAAFNEELECLVQHLRRFGAPVSAAA